MKKNELDVYFSIFITTVILFCLFYFVMMPDEIERRAKAIGIISYDSKTDSFVLKSDTVKITDDDFYYIKHGKIKK